MEIKADLSEEKELLTGLEKKEDAESKRMTRFLNMPDLSRTPGSPLHELVQRLVALPTFKIFDLIEVPQAVSTELAFDFFDFPKDHPARSTSDTYYVDSSHILRPHTTVMWYYYLRDGRVKERMQRKESVGALSYGKVYRKDEIDRRHMNVFHQIDGWYLTPKDQKIITQKDLEAVLADIARAIFGKEVKYRFNKDTFPYTDPSIEMEIEVNGTWVEALGSGVVKGSVLKNFGVDPNAYNGWAFGFGLERLAIISMDLPDIRLLWSDDERIKKQLKLGNAYEEVSKYPPVVRDISFVVDSTFVPNNYFDLIRDLGGDLVEEVELLDTYENPEKFGAGKASYTYRITYRSTDRTLTNKEVDAIQEHVYAQTATQFNAQLR
jgi:phenylalanyl-tRNA synthetase alpha chain